MFIMKKTNKIIFIVFIVIFIGFSYRHFTNTDKARMEISSLSSIDVFKFNSFSKFSNDKIGVIYDEEKLSKFKVIMNSLDTSEGIKKIEVPKDANIESFKYSYHIQPNLKYVEDNNVYDGYFLLYILVGDSEGKSYIIFSGTELSYVLDKNNTNILKEIFLNVKKQQ